MQKGIEESWKCPLMLGTEEVRWELGYALSEGSRGEDSSCNFLASGVVGKPWLSLAYRCIISFSASIFHGIFCLLLLLFYGHYPYWIRVHSNWIWPHINLIMSAMTQFLNKVQISTGVWNFNIFLRGHNSTYTRGSKGERFVLNWFQEK